MKRKIKKIIAGILFASMLTGNVSMNVVYGTENYGDRIEENQSANIEDGGKQFTEEDNTQNQNQNKTEDGLNEDQSSVNTDATEGTEQEVESGKIGITYGKVNFVYIESPYVQTPGTQRIVFSFDKEITGAETIALMIEDEEGNQEEWNLAKQSGTLYLFEKEYAQGVSAGIYKATNLLIKSSAEEKKIALDDIGVKAEFGVDTVKPEVVAKYKETTVKGSQFKQPLLEFSGACAGCGETPYAKLITQLFGERMYIANATGCSSIWGNSSPSTPYTVTPEGKGPAWSNSLFEDNAEFGYGMLLAQNTIRNRLKGLVEKLAADAENEDVKAAAQEYLDTYTCGATNGTATDKLVAALEACGCDRAEKAELLKNKDFLAKKSQWVFGGDGWAYDIGYGGVDHVLASGKDINIMVFDTEVYSNTGGQSSKATKTGATAQFAAGGKETKKKDLAGMAMSYGYVYVAQIAMGADFNQTVKAITEAEAYPGPSLIIAYAPCINHGIKKGMSKAQTEEQLAVECGYWNNFRFNPGAEGDKFFLDSKEPKKEDYQAFLDGEVRYNALKRANPEKAEKLFAINEQEAMERYAYLKKLVDVYKAEE